MTERAETKVETYSRGMLQRLGIADALVKDPSVLILDEPTTSIDPIGVIEILDMLRGLVRERGIAVLLSSHLLSQVQSVCDRVGIFAAGQLIGVGKVEELAQQFGEDAAHIEVGFEGATAEERKAIQKRLGEIKGVDEIQPPARPGEPFVLVTKPATARAVREAALQIAASSGLSLSSIRESVPSLDDIYRHAVRQAGLHRRAAA